MQSTQNQTTTNLWVGELEKWMDEEYFKFVFKSANFPIKNIKLIYDKTKGTWMGYGFWEFETYEQANNVLIHFNGKPMPNSNNKFFKLNWASYSAKNQTQITNDFSIYICEWDPSVSEEMLTQVFIQKYPSVLNAKIVVDPSTKISKGYGFVKFSNYEESQKAIVEMNGMQLIGKPMKTGQASYKKSGNNNWYEKKLSYTNNYGNDNNTNNNNNNNISDNKGVLVDGTVNPSNNIYYNPEMHNMTGNAMNFLQEQQILNNMYLMNGYIPPILNPLYHQMYPGYFQDGVRKPIPELVTQYQDEHKNKVNANTQNDKTNNHK